MEFKNRIPQYPGRVRLTPVSGQTNVYDMAVQDGATVAGTLLNAAAFDAFKQDIIDYINANPGPQGEKGDKGDKGQIIDKKTILVGSNSPNCTGWYKMGSISFSSTDQYRDYHAKMLITSTYERLSGVNMPTGVLSIDIRFGESAWENCFVKWDHLDRVNPNYICYTIINRTLTLYCYIPEQYDYYRLDILGESNRDVYDILFAPAVAYGGINETRYRTSLPASAQYPARNYLRFYVWDYTGEVKEDSVTTLAKSSHKLNTVKGVLIIPKSNAKSTSDLGGYHNFATDNPKYGIKIENDTVYLGIDVGSFKLGFYGLVFGE